MNEVKLSFKSKKLGVIPSLNLPPMLTCAKGVPCAKLCYARKGTFTYNNVIKSHMENYVAYHNDSKAFFDSIHAKLNNGVVTHKFFRWHMSGDIIDMQYLYGMIELANKNKQTKFLAFTKKHDLVNMYLQVSGKKLPKNLNIVFSAWDVNYKFENPFNLPIAYVDFKDKSLNPEIPHNAKHCSGDCVNCRLCWTLKNGECTKFVQH